MNKVNYKDVLEHLNGYCDGDNVIWSQEFELAISKALEELSPVNNKSDNKTILSFKYAEHCYVSISVREGDTFNRMSTVVSFAYYKDNICVELEPEYGPLTIFKLDNEGKLLHHLLGNIDTQSNWSQAEVAASGIKTPLINGDYIAVFDILKKYYDDFK